eukprot:92123_1
MTSTKRRIIVQILLLLFITVHQCLVNSTQCSFKDPVTGYTLDLSSLIATDIVSEEDEFGWIYNYTVCSNGINNCTTLCQGNSMSTQIKGDTSHCLYPLAKFDETVQPYYDHILESWLFQYANGCSANCYNNFSRELNLMWFCDKNSYPYQVVSAFAPSRCIYNFNINSSYSCPNCVYKYGNYTLD